MSVLKPVADCWLRGFDGAFNPAREIGVTAGSRGIGGFVELLNGVCDAVKSCGGKPFILPAMGSHGGATAEGQKRLLNQSGITAKCVPAPIRATMDTVPLGKSKTGAIAHLDMIASEADGIIVLGRVKTHPENKDGVASGLLKMTTVGLGKQVGAQQAHSHGLWPIGRGRAGSDPGESKNFVWRGGRGKRISQTGRD
jgi:hypothetical protein